MNVAKNYLSAKECVYWKELYQLLDFTHCLQILFKKL